MPTTLVQNLSVILLNTVVVFPGMLSNHKICSAENVFAEAYAYCQLISAYSQQMYRTLPEWVSQAFFTFECDELIKFELFAIAPATIRKVLKSLPSNSSPGEDEITYHNLKKLPSAYYFLATPFSKS